MSRWTSPPPVGVGESMGGFRTDRSCLLRTEQATGVQQGPQAPTAEVLEHEARMPSASPQS